MEIYRRNFQDLYGHPNVTVSSNVTYRAGAEWLLENIEEQIRSGSVFTSGETVQIGWMIVLLSDNDDGDLEILEPKFGSMPVEWVEGGNNTIRQILIQNELCDMFEVGADYPSMRQSAVISPNFMDNHQEFELSRDEPTGNDSGWVFREGNYRDSMGALSSLYQISITAPAIIPFLALPAGSIVKRDRTGLEVSANGSKVSSLGNNLLTRLLESAYFTGQSSEEVMDRTP